MKDNNKEKSSQIKPQENGKVNIRIKLDHEVHQLLMFESLQSRIKGEKKLLAEIVANRILRDLKNYPVKING